MLFSPFLCYCFFLWKKKKKKQPRLYRHDLGKQVTHFFVRLLLRDETGGPRGMARAMSWLSGTRSSHVDRLFPGRDPGQGRQRGLRLLAGNTGLPL